MTNIGKLRDDDLIALYVEGNDKAFDIVLDRYKDRLFSYIFFIVKDQEMSEDIFQETFIKAIVTIKNGRYTANGKFYNWMTRIAHNLIFDHFRSEKNDNTVSCEGSEYDLLNNANLCDDNIETDMINMQIIEDLRRMVERLPQNQREIVMMRFYGDLSFKEIAELTGTSINTALGRMRYAILNLRKMAAENNITLTA
ncbi:MAG TPA: sigma-70 family RNA polymerase sigma factor [Candidatus Avibacteroides avistercoris]|uniref:Sigma-70 family RNA polymerase sigma factor n=1 Tax=Candidatus Avibacteroides avistercoris TaxID=2840690 RepID=A0A9D2UHV7_9BACT|nr:sigma-70 family RNA polymerase sigma factor [Candidatus Avibacteroides avistercoris]